MSVPTTQGARRVTLKGTTKFNADGTPKLPLDDLGEWQESGDLEVKGDPEMDRGAYGEGMEPLPTQFEQSERDLTRTFRLPRDRDLLRVALTYASAGGGYLEVQDQYLEPRSRGAFDVPVVSHGQLGGFTASGANINDANGKATIVLTFTAGGMPVA